MTKGRLRARGVLSLGVAGVAAVVIACAPTTPPASTTTTTTDTAPTTEAPTTTEATTTTEAPTTTTTSTTTTTTVVEEEVSTVSVDGAPVEFAGPTSVAIGPDGALYVPSYFGNRVDRVVPGAGGSVTTFATGLSNPASVVFDDAGNAYIADQGNHRIVKVDTAGVSTVFAGSGGAFVQDGTGTGASFISPTGMTVASDGTIYVADRNANNVRAITPAGVVTTVASGLNSPTGVTSDIEKLFVTEQFGHRVVIVFRDSGEVIGLAGTGAPGEADGPRASASFDNPTGIVLADDGTLYVFDNGNHRIRAITYVDDDYVVSTFAGGEVGDDDGPRATATFSGPYGGASFENDFLYVAELGTNHVRKIALP